MAANAFRYPLLTPDRNVRPWQEVLVELAGRLKFPAFTNPNDCRKFKDSPDFIVNYERSPGVDFLAGWRGKDGTKSLKGEPNPNQRQAYLDNQCFFAHRWPDNHSTCASSTAIASKWRKMRVLPARSSPSLCSSTPNCCRSSTPPAKAWTTARSRRSCAIFLASLLRYLPG